MNVFCDSEKKKGHLTHFRIQQNNLSIITRFPIKN